MTVRKTALARSFTWPHRLLKESAARTSGAEAQGKNKGSTAAVNRCATQKLSLRDSAKVPGWCIRWSCQIPVKSWPVLSRIGGTAHLFGV
jgi:hypothetical protein